MSNRERWVVYPLLFFAILLAGRDDMVPPELVKHKTLVCNELFVESPDGEALVTIRRNADSGVIFVKGPDEAPLLKIGHDDELKASGLLALGESGEPIQEAEGLHAELPGSAFAWQEPTSDDNEQNPDKNPGDTTIQESEGVGGSVESSVPGSGGIPVNEPPSGPPEENPSEPAIP